MTKQINDEMLWGVPPKELPDPETERNFFDEAHDSDTEDTEENNQCRGQNTGARSQESEARSQK